MSWRDMTAGQGQEKTLGVESPRVCFRGGVERDYFRCRVEGSVSLK